MMTQNRRSFVRNQLICTSVLFLPQYFSMIHRKKPLFNLCLNGSAIGASYDQMALLEVAHQHGFGAIVFQPEDLASRDTGALREIKEAMQAYHITWGSAGLPIDFRKDAETFKSGLRKLPGVAAIMESVSARRMNTWIMPTNESLTYLENFKSHQQRLKEIANILGHHGIQLGLEYVGPKTLLTRSKYSFIRTMAEARELMDAIGEPNVGFVLDSFHWYCAGEDKSDILSLSNTDIVTVDLNDARTGLTPDTQIDNQRELPLATGVIPLKEFLEGLVQIDYDGPVRAEPFNQALRDMDDEAAVEKTAEAMKKALALVS